LVPQLLTGDEILVIDNNSTDDSGEIARRFTEVHLLRATQQGSYAARNVGCAVAGGDILGFLDPDCVPCTEWRAILAATFVDPSVALIVGGRDLGGSSLALSLIAEYEEARTSWVYGQEDAALYYGYSNNMAVRRSLWQRVGPFVERKRGSDTIFVRRALEVGSTAMARYVPSMRVRHLEIDSLAAYFNKMRTYARSSKRYRRIAPTRPLDRTERLTVLRRLFNERDLSLFSQAVLVSCLGLGLLFWTFGSLSALWAPGDPE
jgi:glycosyltransferase involved in cell wall biosynthesis